MPVVSRPTVQRTDVKTTGSMLQRSTPPRQVAESSSPSSQRHEYLDGPATLHRVRPDPPASLLGGRIGKVTVAVIESVPVGGARICFPLTDGPRRWYTLYPTKKTNESLLTGPERCTLQPNAYKGSGDAPRSRSRCIPPRPGADELETDPLATHFIHSAGGRQWP